MRSIGEKEREKDTRFLRKGLFRPDEHPVGADILRPERQRSVLESAFDCDSERAR